MTTPNIDFGGNSIINASIDGSQLTANSVANGSLAQMPAGTLKGNNTGATATPTDLTAAQALSLLGAAPLASPAFTGTPTAPTAAPGTNTTQIATTAFVQDVVQGTNPPIRTITVQTFTTSGTYTPNANLVYAVIEVQAAGGGGGGTQGGSGIAAAGGGGGGGYAKKLLTASAIGASQAITIGAVGSGGAAGVNVGGVAGATSCGSLLSATGGKGGGGAAAAIVDAPNGHGGGGGVGSLGDLNLSGTAGDFGLSFANDNSGISGAGGNSFLGVGAQAVTPNLAGLTGNNYGGGGSGAASSTSSEAGGDGAPGIVIVTEYNA